MINVSIIVPVYNIEAYLDKCLDSLVRQTLEDIQIIVVNDGSKDNSSKIIEKYKAQYGEKIVYVEKAKGGLSDARNAGIQYANGEYIGCVDGDDYTDITMFEKLYSAAKRENADMAECDYYHVYGSKLKAKTGKTYELKDIMITAKVIACNKIIKKEILEKNKLTFPMGLQYEDMEYFYKLIPYITKVGFVKEPLYYYVQRQDSICHIYDERTTDIFHVLDNILQYYKEKKIIEKYKKQMEYTFARELLGSSFLRMVKIKDRRIRKRILYENWRKLHSLFPDWRKNIILKNRNSLLDIFIKSQNRFTYPIYSELFCFF